jgi:hypothetical protein
VSKTRDPASSFTAVVKIQHLYALTERINVSLCLFLILSTMFRLKDQIIRHLWLKVRRLQGTFVYVPSSRIGKVTGQDGSQGMKAVPNYPHDIRQYQQPNGSGQEPLRYLQDTFSQDRHGVLRGCTGTTYGERDDLPLRTRLACWGWLGWSNVSAKGLQ